MCCCGEFFAFSFFFFFINSLESQGETCSCCTESSERPAVRPADDGSNSSERSHRADVKIESSNSSSKRFMICAI